MSAPPPPDAVEPLLPSGIAEAAAVLAAALADDPGFVHLFPVRARRERELRALYRMTLSDSVRYGHAFVTRLDGEVTGAIALYPPGTYPMTALRWWRQAFRIVRIAAHTREHSVGIIRFGDVTSAGVPSDAWYVEALGVRPDLQRAGRGKRLMATAFGLVDAAGGPSYLETTKPDNVAYYSALGYEPVRSRVPMATDEAGPWIFPMSRPGLSEARASVGWMENVDYTSTFIAVAPDLDRATAVEPVPRGDAPTIASATFDLIASSPYQLRSSDVIFRVWASRHDVDAASADEWAAFYSTPHACLRSSDLGKRYGWGIHADADGRLAVYPVGSAEYSSLAAGTAPDGSAVTVTAAMRSSRR